MSLAGRCVTGSCGVAGQGRGAESGRHDRMASVYSQSTMLEKTLRFIVVAGIFILPFIVLIVSTSLFFPYITGKNFTFRVVVEITVGAWIALACMNASYRPRVSALLAVFAAFVAAIALSDAFGVYPFKSFWSNFERMEGWVTLAHLFAYFTVVVSVMTPALWRRLFQMSLGVSAFVALYGLRARLLLTLFVSIAPIVRIRCAWVGRRRWACGAS